MSNPFQLRMDDVDTLALLYPVTSSNIAAGKTSIWTNALNLEGQALFRTGQGMDGVNVTATRQTRGAQKAEPWQVASSVTGYSYQQNVGNPVTGPESSSENVGMEYGPAEAMFSLPRVEDAVVENVYMTTSQSILVYGRVRDCALRTSAGDTVGVSDNDGGLVRGGGHGRQFHPGGGGCGVELLAGRRWDAERAGELGYERMVERIAVPVRT